MQWTLNDAQQVIAASRIKYLDAEDIELLLRFSGHKKEADDLWASNKRLGHEIDVLIGKAMQDWQTSAAAAIDKIKTATQGFATVTQEIKNNTQVAANVIKVISYIDELVALLAKLI